MIIKERQLREDKYNLNGQIRELEREFDLQKSKMEKQVLMLQTELKETKSSLLIVQMQLKETKSSLVLYRKFLAVMTVVIAILLVFVF